MDRIDIAVIGAGFTGTLLAWHLGEAGMDSIVIGERESFGRGRAYSTTHAEHLLNVPAGGMSAFPDNPDHFLDWLRRDGHDFQTTDFVPRPIYGRYIESVSAGSKTHRLTDVVTSASVSSRGWELELLGGEAIRAGRVVLATGHRPPRIPQVLGQLADRLIPDPYQAGVLELVPPTASVFVIGTGLTAVDLIATLDAARHQGPITTLSRHGRWPARHDLDGPRWTLRRRPRGGAAAHFAWMREEIERGRLEGVGWRRVMDAVRTEAQDLWRGLSFDDRARLLRHARNLWDVTRHQMPPAAAARLDRLRVTGQLRSLTGRLMDVLPGSRGARAVIDTARAQPVTIEFDTAILCTGTETAPRTGGSHLVDRLLAAGHVSADRLGLGVLTDNAGRCLDAEGRIAPRLYAAGPLRRGVLWENIAVPELREETRSLAREIHAALCFE